MRVTFVVDGVRHDLDVEDGRTLADVLAVECGVTGCCVACADGTCRTCAVLLDGEEICSCLMPAVQATGAHLGTPDP